MMNWEMIKGDWNEVKGRLRVHWGKLSDDDLTEIDGHKDRLVGILQQRYGLAKQEARKQIDELGL